VNVFCIFCVQAIALKEAVENSISVIQGPPGTGKSYTAAVIAAYINILDSEPVVLTAPSNFAADGFANKVMEVTRIGLRHKRVLRIYSHSHEDYLFPPTKEKSNICMCSIMVTDLFINVKSNVFFNVTDGSFAILHEEVRKSSEWLQNLKEISDSKLLK